jgi:hypothetical protein
LKVLPIPIDKAVRPIHSMEEGMSITTSWFQQDAGDEQDVAEVHDEMRDMTRHILKEVWDPTKIEIRELALELAKHNLKVAQEELRTAQEARFRR